MYGVPPRGHLQGQTCDNSNTRFFHTKKKHKYMCSYIISVVYICRIMPYMKDFALFYHIPHTHTECICRWKCIKNKKSKKMKHAYNKDNFFKIIMKR